MDSIQKKALTKMVISLVTAYQGLKATDLAMKVVERAHEEELPFPSSDITQEDYFNLVQELVETEMITEIEYILPEIQYKTKSFLLPKDTVVRISLL